MKQRLIVTMPDGSRWGVPVDLIARDRAKHYAGEFDGDVERSLAEDTVPLFADDYEIIDWAQNNMNWKDVEAHAGRMAESEPDFDYQEGWVNGDKQLV